MGSAPGRPSRTPASARERGAWTSALGAAGARASRLLEWGGCGWPHVALRPPPPANHKVFFGNLVSPNSSYQRPHLPLPPCTTCVTHNGQRRAARGSGRDWQSPPASLPHGGSGFVPSLVCCLPSRPEWGPAVGGTASAHHHRGEGRLL